MLWISGFFLLLGVVLLGVCAMYMLDPEARGLKIAGVLFAFACLSIGVAMYLGAMALGILE